MTIRLGLTLALIVVGFTMTQSAVAQLRVASPQQHADAEALPLLIADFSIGSETALVQNYSVAPPLINPPVAAPPPDAWYPMRASFPQVIATSCDPAIASMPLANGWNNPQSLAAPQVIPAKCESDDVPPPPPEACDWPRQVVNAQANTAQAYSGPATSSGCGGGFYAGTEVTLLRPFAGELNETELSVPLLGVDFLKSDPADQIGAGRESGSAIRPPTGPGCERRYWQFDQRLSSVSSDSPLGILPLGSERMSIRQVECIFRRY